jgi:anti-anti-sigma factor
MDHLTDAVFRAPQAWLTLRGEYDVASRDELRRRFLDSRHLGCGEIVVDASELTFIDCAALAAIAEARRECSESGGRVTVTGASTYLRLICWLAGYEELLHSDS